MSELFWQAKIWGLLHDPPLKALRDLRNLGNQGPWDQLTCMNGWISPKGRSKSKDDSNSQLNGTWLDYVGLCDLIASSSDRTSIGRLPSKYSAVIYGQSGLQIRHLLSGEGLSINSWSEQLSKGNRREFINQKENQIPDFIKTSEDSQESFWWFWRCYPEVIAKETPETHILPADTRIPDASLWSHCTMTSALAGSLAGYYSNIEDYPKKGKSFKRSRPFLVTFTFTPIQEVIQASRKMRDFWAGSWVLHYLSAKVCWSIAQKYGPDTLIYPCLYDQPLIDHWLLTKYPYFEQWISDAKQPGAQQGRLLTAGFPNVLVMVLPDNGQGLETGGPIAAAMQFAKQTLKNEWRKLGQKVLCKLQRREEAWRDIYPKLWDSWLEAQWQTYWTASPLGDYEQSLHQSPRDNENYHGWVDAQNSLTCPKNPLFSSENEEPFLKAVFKLSSLFEEYTEEEIAELNYKVRQPNLNVGSWWSSLVEQLRSNLRGLKNGRTWQIPTAIGPRSTISGIGPVIRPPSHDSEHPEWATEGETHQFWLHHAGMFDGVEELNATEVLKRGLHQVLADELKLEQRSGKIPVLYPDLSSGVAGWLKQLEELKDDDDTALKEEVEQKIQCYITACNDIAEHFNWTVLKENSPGQLPWGIPWITKNHSEWQNPRLLNAGWLIDDFEGNQKEREKNLKDLKERISEHFTVGNNPTDWYVLASGDGDDMGKWLSGEYLKDYKDYIASDLSAKLDQMPKLIREPFERFLEVKKRMGPSTHAALSRALLDFSNQLVPYLTEQRYAGRLIYCGGDDILAYSNLWEWDSWLWDILQCFKGQDDPHGEFLGGSECGDYWLWKESERVPDQHFKRPLFTMGGEASISFGLVIAHHSVPLAIALENMQDAKEAAKAFSDKEGEKKDAIQIRVLYGNGNQLQATAKSKILASWQKLIDFQSTHRDVGFDPALFEQAAEIIEQHPIPIEEAISSWVNAFCERRDIFKNTDKGRNAKAEFNLALSSFIQDLWKTAPEKDFGEEVRRWLKLAAFTLRKRDIKPRKMTSGGQG